jgi:hypothetical protein
MRSILGVVLAAVVLFAWGTVFWMFTGLGSYICKGVPNESALMDAVKAQNLPDGNYVLPFPDEAAIKSQDPKAMEAFAEKARQGPLVRLQYRSAGDAPMSLPTFGMGFVHMLISSSLVAILLCLAGANLPSFLARWLFVVTLGVFAAVNIHLANPIWFQHPWTPSLMLAFFASAGWVLAGVPLAALVKPRS